MSFNAGGQGRSGFGAAGLKEAQQGLLEFFNKAFGDISRAAFQAVTEETVNEMKSNAPVITGFLRDNIEATSVTNKQAVIESQADYSGFVNFGTIYQSANPFFTTALQDFAKNFISQYGRDVGYQWRLIAGKYSATGFAGSLKAL